MQRSLVVLFLSLILCASALSQDRGIIQCDPGSTARVPAWASPAGANVIEQLDCGQTVSIIARERGDYRIQIGDRVGYVNAKYIELLQPQTAQERQIAKPNLSGSVPAQYAVGFPTLPKSESSEISSPKMSSQDAKDLISLRWKLRRGDTLYYDMSTKITLTGSSSETHEMAIGFIQEVTDVDEREEATISISTDYVKANVKGEVSGFYDSRSGNPPRDDFSKALSGLKNISAIVRINSRGDILQAKVFNPYAKDPTPEEEWMGNISQMFPILPRQSVKVGESWGTITKSPMPDKADRSVNKMTLRDLTDQSRAIITQRSELLSGSDQKAKQDSDSIELNSSSEILWNMESGRPEQITTKIDLWSAKSSDRGVAQWDIKMRQAGSAQSSIPSKYSPAFSQERPQRLSEIKTIRVASFGTAEGADIIREKVINRIVKSGQLSIVEEIDQADAVLTGVGEIRQGIHVANGSGGTNYDATLVVRLIAKDRRILWVDEAKPTRFFTRSVSSSVADKIAKNLLKAIEKDRVGNR